MRTFAVAPSFLLHFNLEMSQVLATPETQALRHSLDDLDSLEAKAGTSLDALSPPFSTIVPLSLYPSPWEEIRVAIKSLLSPDGRKAFDMTKIRGGRMGLRLVWLALENATDVDDTWERAEVLLWCSRLLAAVEEKL